MTPAVRISLSLVALTVSIVLLADTFFGIFPDRVGPELEARKRLCQSLAVQFSSLAERNDLQGIEKAMAAIVERTPEVLSVGLRSGEEGLLASTSEHARIWPLAHPERSTPTHVRVPIFEGDRPWGTVEVAFDPLPGAGLLQFFEDPLYRLLVVVALGGFALYLLLMRRTLRYLDPTSVVPGRVRAALDQLVEGAILLDEELRIVLSNAAFAETVGRTPEALLGTHPSELEWRSAASSDGTTELPWEQVSRDGGRRTDVRLELQTPKRGLRTLAANVSPIVDGAGRQRGVLATFDDISELERANRELKQTIGQLEEAEAEIRRQNDELRRLATEDSLTGCLNRRAFNAKLESEFQVATRDDRKLSCIMADIDHFKSINDNYGHAVGDLVIKEMAAVLGRHIGANDAVGRYGGEEFCVVLTGTDADEAMARAERAREEFKARSETSSSPTSGKPVTASFGVSAIGFGAATPQAMVDEADQALYHSKTTGRDRVTSWLQLTASNAKAS